MLISCPSVPCQKHVGDNDQLIYEDPAVSIRSGSTRLRHAVVNSLPGDIVVVVFGQLFHPDSPDTQFSDLDSSLRDKRAADTVRAVVDGQFDRLAIFDGSFAFVVWDQRQRILHACNDRFGTLPLYVSKNEGRTVVSTDPRLANQNGDQAQITPSVATQLFACRYVIDDSTLFRGVRSLPPASLVTISPNEFKAVRYRLPYPNGVQPINSGRSNPRESVARQDELGERLETAVAQSIKGYSRIMVPLSGGLDSRAVLGALLKYRDARDIETFTVGTPGTLDYDIGSLVAQHAGTRHRKINLVEIGGSIDEFTRRSCNLHGLVNPIDNMPWREIDAFADGRCLILTGFLGETATGSHLTRPLMAMGANMSITKRLTMALEKQGTGRLPERGDHLEVGVESILSELLDCANRAADIPASDDATWMMRWDFLVRQSRFITPIVMPRLDNGVVASPFTRSVFWRFAEDLRRDELFGQSLYKAMLLRRYSKLFRLPTKTHNGRSLVPGNVLQRALRRITAAVARRMRPSEKKTLESNRRMSNYYSRADILREEGSFQQAMHAATNIAVDAGLINRQAIERSWSEHESGSNDHSEVIFAAARVGACCRYVDFLNGVALRDDQDT